MQFDPAILGGAHQIGSVRIRRKPATPIRLGQNHRAARMKVPGRHAAAQVSTVNKNYFVSPMIAVTHSPAMQNPGASPFGEMK